MRLLIVLFFISNLAFANTENGLVTTKSNISFSQTKSKLFTVLKKKGFTIFATIDHKQNAEKIKTTISPNTTIIFGNPKVGTPLMSLSPSFGIDLPVKIQIYEDNNAVYVAYNDPTFLAKRHSVKKDVPQIQKMSGALKKISGAITK